VTKIILNESCGNSPKNDFLVHFATAYARGDVTYILGIIPGEITWNIVGDKLVRGKMDFKNVIQQYENPAAVAELAIEHVATHGRAGAVDGSMTMVNGTRTAFCHVIDFSSAKGDGIKAITTYLIELDK
jgi:hypothetical protein